jgi:hypothetical protein
VFTSNTITLSSNCCCVYAKALLREVGADVEDSTDELAFFFLKNIIKTTTTAIAIKPTATMPTIPSIVFNILLIRDEKSSQ